MNATSGADSAVNAGDGFATVAVFHQNADEAARLADLLCGAGYRVVVSNDAKDIEALCRREKAEVALLDARDSQDGRPDADEFQSFRGLTEGFTLKVRPEGEGSRDVPVIVMISAAREEKLERALEAGAFEILLKPISREELLRRVGTVTRLSRLRAELKGLRAKLARANPNTEGSHTGGSNR